MDAHIKKVYVPMTETGIYILLCLQKSNHGYGVVQMVRNLTDGEILLSKGKRIKEKYIRLHNLEQRYWK